MNFPIYLDNHATTPVDPDVLKEMLPYFSEIFGNPSSKNHQFGWKAEEGMNKGRAQVASLIGATPDEIIFTSGATESNNMALKGVIEAYKEKGNHLITSTIEHKSILEISKYLEKQGCVVTYIPTDKYGIVDPDDIKKEITEKTVLISIMFANNEIGTIEPISEIGKIAKEKGVFFHTDAAQAVGKIPIDVEKMGIDLLSISAHKFYGPKGIGALYVRNKNPRVFLTPLIHGGGHEKNLRSGTPNVAGIVGFGKACEISSEIMEKEQEKIKNLRDRLMKGIMDKLDDVYLNGHPTLRLPGNLNLSFSGIEAESLITITAEIAISTGSACDSENISHVLKGIGLDEDLAFSSIRFGIGRFNTEEEIDYAIEKISENVTYLRKKMTFN